MNLLNQSLDDVQEMRGRVTSVASVMDSFNAQFDSYGRQIGDVTQSNTEIRKDAIAVEAKVKKLGVSVRTCDDPFPNRLVANVGGGQIDEPGFASLIPSHSQLFSVLHTQY